MENCDSNSRLVVGKDDNGKVLKGIIYRPSASKRSYLLLITVADMTFWFQEGDTILYNKEQCLHLYTIINYYGAKIFDDPSSEARQNNSDQTHSQILVSICSLDHRGAKGGTIRYPEGGLEFLSRANYLFQPGSVAR